MPRPTWGPDLFIDALRAGERPEIHGDGKQSRDFTYIDDVIAANLAAAGDASTACSGKAYNVAGGRRWSLLELLDILGRLVGVEPNPQFTDPRPGDVRHSEADVRAAARDLGFRTEVGFEEGLRRTAEAFAPASARLAA